MTKMGGNLYWLLVGCTITSICTAAEIQASNLGDARLSEHSDAKTHFRLHEYASLSDWQDRRILLRRQILVAAGLDLLPPKYSLNPKRFGKQRFGRYTVEKVQFESFPGYYVAGNLYLPVASSLRHPGILVPHGHWKHGRVHNTTTYSVPALCANLAAQGFVAFAYDMVGYNDTRQTPHVFGGSQAEMAWSYSPLGLQLWNSIRALDFLESLKEVDGGRIGITGASGGATQTILLTAVDDRVKASAPVDMVSASFQGDDACEIAPGLRTGTNNVEIAALMAPKPMLLVSATGDWTKHTPMVEFPAISSIYRLYGHAELVSCAHIHSPHNYNMQSRESVYAFFHRFLLNEPLAGSASESEDIKFRPEDLLIGQAAPPTAGGQLQLFELWKSEMRKLNYRLAPAQMRDRLFAAMCVQWPRQVHMAVQSNSRIVIERDGSGEQVNADWLRRPGTSAVVHVDRTGPQWLDLPSDVSQLHIEVFQQGASRNSRSTDAAYLTFHRSDDANRVQDILTSIAYLRQAGREHIELVCSGQASGWCMLAAAVSPVPVTFNLPVGTDEEIARTLFVPGLQHAGGIPAVRALAAASASPLFRPKTLFSVPADN
jgi:Acetyl xylan esterase (AXE1)